MDDERDACAESICAFAVTVTGECFPSLSLSLSLTVPVPVPVEQVRCYLLPAACEHGSVRFGSAGPSPSPSELSFSFGKWGSGEVGGNGSLGQGRAGQGRAGPGSTRYRFPFRFLFLFWFCDLERLAGSWFCVCLVLFRSVSFRFVSFRFVSTGIGKLEVAIWKPGRMDEGRRSGRVLWIWIWIWAQSGNLDLDLGWIWS